MPFFKEDTKDYSRAMKNMLVELNTIKQTCNPDQKEEIDTKNMDKYQKKRLELITAMEELGRIIKDLAEQKQKSGKSEHAIIKLKNDLRKQTKEVKELLIKLNEIFDKDKQKNSKKLGSDKIEERARDIRKLENQFSKMTDTAGIGSAAKNNPDRVRSRTEQRRRDREDKKMRRNKKKKVRQGDQDFEIRTVEVSEKEQIFLDEVNANRQKEDEMLDEISKGLDDLKMLGQDINKTLNYQKELLSGVEQSLEEVTEKFETGNQKLNDLLEQQGGVTKWIPRLCCVLILLAVVGVLAKMML